MINFPQLRLRRLRRNEAMRELVRETALDKGDLVYPLFVVEGKVHLLLLLILPHPLLLLLIALLPLGFHVLVHQQRKQLLIIQFLFYNLDKFFDCNNILALHN